MEFTNGEPASYRDCFKGVNFRRTKIIVILNVLQQFVGITLLANASYFLQMAGLSSKYSLMINQIGIGVNMLANVVSWFTVPTIGRRRLILISVVLDFFSWTALGIAGCFDNSTALWSVSFSISP
jgi:SP family general alpha glucoside:H+ symporter-like MFS transporter